MCSTATTALAQIDIELCAEQSWPIPISNSMGLVQDSDISMNSMNNFPLEAPGKILVVNHHATTSISITSVLIKLLELKLLMLLKFD